MSAMLEAARIAAAVNVTLLILLAGIWARNYRQIQSRLTLGTLAFAILLACENALAFYYYTFSGIALSAPAIRAMMYLQILETVAITALAIVTWQ